MGHTRLLTAADCGPYQLLATQQMKGDHSTALRDICVFIYIPYATSGRRLPVMNVISALDPPFGMSISPRPRLLTFTKEDVR